MERGEDDGACDHFNALTDAEWAGLQSSANRTAVHNRDPVYVCELEPQHPGPHMALAQVWAGGDDVWLCWDRALRKLVTLPHCPAETGPVDEPDECLLFADHPGAHTFERAVAIEGIRREASPEILARMEALLQGAETP
ncbi:hypothetical protein [Nonomuraea sp. NPDC052265]|uniref:hypothetical protein n=1 Tax=Nonomuraea sp. NPDC052265 TaxID=3364374 RepID=UPI0037CB9FB6